MSLNKNAYNDDIKNNKTPYFMVPNGIHELGLSTVEFYIYTYLISHAETWTPGIRLIQKQTDLSKSTISKALKSLSQKGFIKINKGKKGCRDHYSINVWSIAIKKVVSDVTV